LSPAFPYTHVDRKAGGWTRVMDQWNHVSDGVKIPTGRDNFWWLSGRPSEKHWDLGVSAPTLYAAEKIDNGDSGTSGDRPHCSRLVGVTLRCALREKSAPAMRPFHEILRPLVTGSCAKLIRPYFGYLGGDFEFFCPVGASRCTDEGKIRHPCKFHPHRCTGGVWASKIENFTQISEYKRP